MKCVLSGCQKQKKKYDWRKSGYPEIKPQRRWNIFIVIMTFHKNPTLKIFFYDSILKKKSKTDLIQPPDFLKLFLIINYLEFPYEHFKWVLVASITEKTSTAHPVEPWTYMGLAVFNLSKTRKDWKLSREALN